MAKKRVAKKPAKTPKAKYVIVRCRNAGVHCGEYLNHTGQEVVLHDARRIWYWKGAASLSEIAVHGCKFPSECKISVPVSEITLTEACEIITCEAAAEKWLREVPPWQA